MIVKEERLSFVVGEFYSRKDVYQIMSVPEGKRGGNWDTGYSRFNNDCYVFANIGASGRTGHDYPNRFDGNDLVWYAKNGSKLSHNSIQSLLNPTGKVYIFVRESNDNPNFLYLGNGKVKSFRDTSPVNIVWQFTDPRESHPEILTEEVSESEKLVEGAIKQVFVNIYERNPLARKRCIEHYGVVCSVCEFNFADHYGEIGEGFIHVHHLKSLREIGKEYEINPIKDLKPVCPNCHAMLHKRKPEPYSIEELRGILWSQKKVTRKVSVKSNPPSIAAKPMRE
ncbi:DUF3427 domain-containing protein [Paenibacillus sp. MAHUQ-46]|uniref:DUF3427 domain-containing protein n=2 Tax=Paenibacillus TaxID=44249 RepID=A0A934IW25_9BACL|nr:DUF3427 domain-containing protein [Paenibacillus roseus]